MADISPVQTQLPRTSEYTKFSILFTPILESNESLISLKIIEWDENKGVEVVGASAKGEYVNLFPYGKDRLLYRKGNEWSYLENWDDINEPNKTDVYYWRAPTQPVFVKYVVRLDYRIQQETESGGSSRATTSTSSSITKTYTHPVYPNWDRYAEKLRKQVETRRKTWQEGDVM